VTTPPDYQDVLNHLKQVIASPAQKVEAEALPSHCQPCEGGIAALGKDKVEQLLARFRGWEVVENKKIVKEFKFSDYREATYFVDMVSLVAQEQGHHPSLTLGYNKVKITFSTHAAGGLTENDFIMAKLVDELGA
ncbi:MAG: 4a-hydroxytetrahydrobiopterin dehydratase, partial [Candidatus Omnitrophica bacterium]|nr:4a-hydroxytetrahydrobiopterin dehydratase [Candidatus Omnitrophota bacterium]